MYFLVKLFGRKIYVLSVWKFVTCLTLFAQNLDE